VRCFVVAGFLLTSASRGPSAIAEPLVFESFNFYTYAISLVLDYENFFPEIPMVIFQTCTQLDVNQGSHTFFKIFKIFSNFYFEILRCWRVLEIHCGQSSPKIYWK